MMTRKRFWRRVTTIALSYAAILVVAAFVTDQPSPSVAQRVVGAGIVSLFGFIILWVTFVPPRD